MQEVTIYTQAQSLAVKEYQGQRVVTFKDIDTLHQRPDGTAGRNFRENKHRFIEGEDYFNLSFEEIRATNFVERPNSQGLIVLTQMGYLMLVKSFTDDLAWHIQRQLVKNYFDTHYNGAGIALEQRQSAEGTYITANNKSLEIAFISSIKEALNSGYYLRRQRLSSAYTQDETKLLGTYNGDYYYIIGKRAYKLYAATTETPAPMKGIYAYLLNGGIIEPNTVKVDKEGVTTHVVTINYCRYKCLAFRTDKVKFKKQ